VRANERSDRPSGPFKTRLSRLETGPRIKKGFNTYRKEVTMKREKTVQNSTVQRSSVQYIAVECYKGKSLLLFVWETAEHSKACTPSINATSEMKITFPQLV